MAKQAIAVDLARVYASASAHVPFTVLSWGDVVDVLGTEDHAIRVRVWAADHPDGNVAAHAREGILRVPKRMAVDDVVVAPSTLAVLKLNFVDIEQGDACVLESPRGRVVLVDGGQNQMFARYLAARFHGTRPDAPREIDAIVISHGDADHFDGLTQILRSEHNEDPRKRLFIHPRRIFHNGIYKRPSQDAHHHKRADRAQLNDTIEHAGRLYLQPLVDEVTALPGKELNASFRAWADTVAAWRARGPIEERRIACGDSGAFAFLRDEAIDVQVLGPLTEQVRGKPALPFLGAPPKRPKLGNGARERDFKGHSASHTINGHSVVLRVVYGGFAFLLTGDLNEQAARALVRQHDAGALELRAHVLKVPHHGSADFAPELLQAVGATVAIISSGDESERVEYIHPRASLVGALGRYSPAVEPIVLCTELIAFFKRIGWAAKDKDQRSTPHDAPFVPDPKGPRFYGFQRTAYGLVKMRCDGRRLVVSTNSGKDDLQEAYAFDLDGDGQARPTPVRTV